MSRKVWKNKFENVSVIERLKRKVEVFSCLVFDDLRKMMKLYKRGRRCWEERGKRIKKVYSFFKFFRLVFYWVLVWESDI